MPSHLKRLLQHSVVFGLSETISRGTGFILVYYYQRALQPEDLGLRTLMYGAVAFVSLFYTLGLDNAFLRFFMDREYRGERHAILSTSFFFTLAVGCLFWAAGMFSGGAISSVIASDPAYAGIVRTLLLIMILDTVVVYPTLVLRAEGRLMYYSVVALTRFVLMIGLNILLISVMGHGVRGIFEANLVCVAVIALMLTPVYVRYLRPVLSARMLTMLLSFGLPTIFTLFFTRVIDFSDRFFIERMLGTASVGFYTPAYTLGMVGIMTFVNSFRLAWQPFFLSVMEKPDAPDLFARIATYYTLFMGMVLLGMTLYRDLIFTLYAPSRYPVVLAGIIPLIGLSYLLYGFYFIMTAGVFIRRKTKYLPIAPITGATINVVLNFWFVPRYGLYGAAYTTILAHLSMVLVLHHISKRIYGVAYEYGRIGRILVACLIPAAAAEIIPSWHQGLLFVLHGILWMTPILYFRYSSFLKDAERAVVNDFIRRRFSRHARYTR